MEEKEVPSSSCFLFSCLTFLVSTTKKRNGMGSGGRMEEKKKLERRKLTLYKPLWTNIE
jgi:hypothetical protein